MLHSWVEVAERVIEGAADAGIDDVAAALAEAFALDPETLPEARSREGRGPQRRAQQCGRHRSLPGAAGSGTHRNDHGGPAARPPHRGGGAERGDRPGGRGRSPRGASTRASDPSSESPSRTSSEDPGGNSGALTAGSIAQAKSASVVEVLTRPVTPASLLDGSTGHRRRLRRVGEWPGRVEHPRHPRRVARCASPPPTVTATRPRSSAPIQPTASCCSRRSARRG